LEGGAADSDLRSRKLCNDILKNEKVSFMSRLHKSRYQRTTLENIAAILIQKIFRGYWIRSHQQLIQLRSKMQLHMRHSILSASLLLSTPLSTLAQYRQKSYHQYHHSALTIQCSYRCYLTRVYIYRKRYEHYHLQRSRSVIKIQSLIRQKIGSETVKMKREKNILFVKFQAALLIQSLYRKLSAKRKLYQRRYKLQWLAARMIQTAFRGRNTRQSFAFYKTILQRIKLFKASRTMQCLIRKKIAKQRMKRMKMRRLYLKIFQASVRIQTLIRHFLGKRQIKKQKILQEKEKLEKQEKQEQVEKEVLVQQTKQLSDAMDIFLQAELGNISEVDSLYHHEIEIGNQTYCQEVNQEGNTVLSLAVKCGHLDLVRKCLLWGYDINHVNQMGESVVGLSAEKMHSDIILYLLNYVPPSSSSAVSSSGIVLPPSQKLELSDEDAGMVITALAKATDLKYMKSFLEKYSNKVNTPHPINESIALHVACELGNVEMTHLLLRHGSCVDVADDMGQLPIHKACSSSSLQVIKILFGLSDVDYPTIRCTSNFHRNELLLKKDIDGKDSLLLSALYGRSEVMKYLLTILDTKKRKELQNSEVSWSGGDILLVQALVEDGNIECLKMVMECGYDLTWVPESTGSTVMMRACLVGKMRMIDFLLEKGVDLTTLDHEGRNCFHYAAQCGDEAVIPYLLSSGNKAPESCHLSPNLLLVTDKSGQTPVHLIAQYGTSLSFDLLAQDHLTTAVNTTDNSGKTPLLIACDFNQTNTIKHLLTLGPHLNHRDLRGRNALWYYFFPTTRDDTQRRQLTLNPMIENEMVKLLIESGCSLYSSLDLREMESLQQLYEKYRSCPLDVVEKQTLLDELTVLIEPADICAAEGKLSLLNLFSDLVDSETSWRLGMSSSSLPHLFPS
jgi:ankyrin repeat protein